MKMNKIKISDNFSLWEFECPCCKKVMLDEKLLKELQILRFVIDLPILVNSGYRCEMYNKRIGGDLNSYHKLGKAVDITVPDMDIKEVMLLAKELEFNGIGLYEKENYLHLDTRPGEKKIWKG